MKELTQHRPRKEGKKVTVAIFSLARAFWCLLCFTKDFWKWRLLAHRAFFNANCLWDENTSTFLVHMHLNDGGGGGVSEQAVRRQAYLKFTLRLENCSTKTLVWMNSSNTTTTEGSGRLGAQLPCEDVKVMLHFINDAHQRMEVTLYDICS